jgi:serine/threonine-protein kinase
METEERLKAALADRYQIEREIGRGGMATVYLAQDLRHKRKVAVKVLDPSLAEALGYDRFLREIEVAANFTHPHILPVHDSGEADGFLYYVMPFVEGESLRDRLDREKQLPVETAIQVTREIAGALAYAHERGVIHRDVKPANILLEAGHAVLADFGVAQAVAAAEDSKLTGTGVSIGTPAYMSPEQAAGEKEVDGRSDQYALASITYEMLAGNPPHTGATMQAVVAKVLSTDPQPISEVRSTVPANVEAAIRKALERVPADRFPGVEEFARALEDSNFRLAAPKARGGVGKMLVSPMVAVALAIGVVTGVAVSESREGKPDPGDLAPRHTGRDYPGGSLRWGHPSR